MKPRRVIVMMEIQTGLPVKLIRDKALLCVRGVRYRPVERPKVNVIRPAAAKRKAGMR